MDNDHQRWNAGRPPEFQAENAGLMERLLYEVKRLVVGQDMFLERMLVAILAQGHLLVEGVPGLAKTLTVNTFARAIHGSFRRIQFTPDLLPADLVGTRIFNQNSGEFSTVLGPVFANLVLADEINRAPAKVQSALLEVMQEKQVTIAGFSHRVPLPFLVMATQNPIETEGTYPLPEAQVDRFMMKVLVGYPREEEEFVIVQRMIGPPVEITPVRLVCATREPQRFGLPQLASALTFGASPRATIWLIEGARALAFLRGRAYVVPQDVTDLVPDVLRHRLVLSSDALSEGLSADDIVMQVLKAVAAPDRPLESHVRVA